MQLWVISFNLVFLNNQTFNILRISEHYFNITEFKRILFCSFYLQQIFSENKPCFLNTSQWPPISAATVLVRCPTLHFASCGTQFSFALLVSLTYFLPLCCLIATYHLDHVLCSVLDVTSRQCFILCICQAIYLLLPILLHTRAPCITSPLCVVLSSGDTEVEFSGSSFSNS